MLNTNDCNIRALLACIEEIDPSFKLTEKLVQGLKKKFGRNVALKVWQKENYPSIIFNKESSYTKVISAAYGMSLFMPKYTFEVRYDVDIKKLPTPCMVVLKRKGHDPHSVCLTGEDDVYLKVKDSDFPGCSLLMSKEYARAVVDEPGNPLKFVVVVRLKKGVNYPCCPKNLKIQ